MARKSQNAEQLKKELISNVQQHDLITQPVTFAYLNGEMSIMQTRIQTRIMEKLQLRIADALKKKSKGTKEKGEFVGNLFDEKDFAPIDDGGEKYLTFTIKYSDLGIPPSNYKYISKAAKGMMGLAYELKKDGYIRNISVFPIVDVPDETKGERHTDIKLHMTESMAKYLFKITPYHRYLKDAVFLFSSAYTGRIYLLLNANKQLGTWKIEFEELRKILLTSYDREKKTYSCTKYKNIKDFKKRVLDTARKEMLEAEKHIDCTFDYDVVHDKVDKKKLIIAFHIHLTDVGKNIKRGQLESKEAVQLRDSLTALHLSLTDASRLMKQITPDKYSTLTDKANELKKYYDAIREGRIKDITINDYHAHAYKSLQNFIRDQDFADAEEIKEIKEEKEAKETKPSQAMSEW